ncbi:hypothetical protein J2X36_004393 [Methylobacterium sp. BE186]|uniref:hypothetical protein n=1 Tax=Methylobacterium sp. BE186 TaxID=2817715 RepID=UPI002863550C|nr:hypothetical protein [Methylobacterium sp. BE186]MDR7039617.1 hypothetical protein [Methylobacterium sp. BE186]
MQNDGPPILFVLIGGLFAATLMLGQYRAAQHGLNLTALYDNLDVEADFQFASLE